MLEVFLVSLAISCFKVQEVADIYVGLGLYCLISMQILLSVLLTKVSVRRYWDAWQPEDEHISDKLDTICHSCHLTQEALPYCRRCGSRLHHRIPKSLQKHGHTLSPPVFLSCRQTFTLFLFL